MKAEGEAIKIYIEEKHINKTQLAKALGMSRTNLYQLFESKNLEEKTKNKICKYLRVSFSDIYNYKKLVQDIYEAPIKRNVVEDTKLHYHTEIFYLKEMIKMKDELLRKSEETIEILKGKLPGNLTNDNKTPSKKEI